jgi:hypothetical protein
MSTLFFNALNASKNQQLQGIRNLKIFWFFIFLCAAANFKVRKVTAESGDEMAKGVLTATDCGMVCKFCTPKKKSPGTRSDEGFKIIVA